MAKHFERGALLLFPFLLVACGGGGGSDGGGPPPQPPGVGIPIMALFIATQPSGGTPTTPFATQPVIQLRTEAGTNTADNSTIVSVAIVAGTGTAGAKLTGTTSASAVAGVVTFSNLGIDTAGTGYELRFTPSSNGYSANNSAAVAIVAPGSTLSPGTLPSTAVSFNIHSTRDSRQISRFIYGMNGWDPRVRPAHLALSRSGGNRMTAYNWENNASNAGADWFNQNDDFLGGGITPNGAVAPDLERARAAGAGMIVTLPLIGYVAADKNGGGDVAGTPASPVPNYLAVRFRQSLARKPAAFSLSPDTTDAFVYQDEYVNFLAQTYPGAFAATAANPIMVNLDNEPDLWQSTHARLRGDTNPATQAGTTATYAEMIQRTVDYAGSAKAVAPTAQIFGPVNYGWQGMIRFQDASDAGGRDFLGFYLQQMAAAESTAGRRLVDVLDVHWYPEARGTCSTNPMDGCRISDGGAGANEAAVVAARIAAPRSLWDNTYTENSWIAQFSTAGPIRLLPRLAEKIAANYPGTKLAITEYNYGGATHISGAIAQADVLGIFGREGLYAATLWRLESANDFIYGGFDAFRNYNGANGSFGDTSIDATTTNRDTTSVYASVDAGSDARVVVVAINKSATAQTAGISLTHTRQLRTAQVYQVTAANSVPQRQADIDIATTNAFVYAMPGYSVTTLVLQ